MKVLLCTKCVDVRALDPAGGWTACRCGNTEARWLDPNTGTVRVRAKNKEFARILGLNNAFLLKAAEGFTHREMVEAGGQWEAWRKLHEECTHSPGFVFDKQFRACWACVIKVNETGDIKWEEEPTPAT